MPFKTWLDRGILWAGGSDFNVTPFSARYGIWASISRTPLKTVYGASPFGSKESIDVHNALRSYTVWAAHQMFLQTKVGSLQPGKYADIAVWDRNLYAIPTADIKNLKCQLMMLGGKIVYNLPDAALKISSK